MMHLNTDRPLPSISMYTLSNSYVAFTLGQNSSSVHEPDIYTSMQPENLAQSITNLLCIFSMRPIRSINSNMLIHRHVDGAVLLET